MNKKSILLNLFALSYPPLSNNNMALNLPFVGLFYEPIKEIEMLFFVRITTILFFFLTIAPTHAAVIYTADHMPQTDGWTIVNYPAYESGHVTIDTPGILHLNDPNTYGGSAAHYYKDFYVGDNADIVYAEWKVKANYNTGFGSFFAFDRVAGGGHNLSFKIDDDSIIVNNVSAAITANDTFHTYRAEIEANTYRIYQDSTLLLTGSASGSNGDTVRIHFGLGSSSGTAEYFLDEIRAGSGALSSIPEPSPFIMLGMGLLLFRLRK